MSDMEETHRSLFMHGISLGVSDSVGTIGIVAKILNAFAGWLIKGFYEKSSDSNSKAVSGSLCVLSFHVISQSRSSFSLSP